MRRVTWLYLVCMCLLPAFLPAVAQAKIITFNPKPADLWDLEHSQYYTWGINWKIPAGEHIGRASIFIDNINDWQVEDNDILYIHLLDEPLPGAKYWSDKLVAGDDLKGQGPLLTTYTDDDPLPNPPEDWTYKFTEKQVDTLNTYAANGLFGLGFDPDCHYYNDGITFTLELMPEPGTALLSLSALGLLGRARRAHVGCRSS